MMHFVLLFFEVAEYQATRVCFLYLFVRTGLTGRT